MLLANQNESINSGKGSINHVKWWHLWWHFMRPVGQTNFWWHLWWQTAICQSNVFTVFWWEIYFSVKSISSSIYDSRPQYVNQMHLQYFGGKYTYVNQIQKQHLWWQNVVIKARKYYSEPK